MIRPTLTSHRLLKVLCTATAASLLLTACGSDNDDFCCNVTPNPVVSSSSAASSSDAGSSNGASSSAPSADLSYGFSESIEGWYINGQDAGTTVSTQISLEHDAINNALKITPLDWTGDNWRFQARYDFDEVVDLSNSTIEFTVSIPSSYITDNTLEFQYIINNGEANASYGSTTPVSGLPEANADGDYVIGRDINIVDAKNFGLQLAKAPTDTSIKDAILVKNVLIKRPAGAGGGNSSSSSSAGGGDNTIQVSVTSDWGNDGSPVTISYDNGVVATPDWATPAQYGHTAMIVLPEPLDLTGAIITYVVDIPESYVNNGGASGGMTLQLFAQQNSGSYAGVWNGTLPNDQQVVGENTYVLGPLESPPADLQRIGIKLLEETKAAGVTGSVVIKSITIQLP